LRTGIRRWDPTASVEANIDRARRENVFGKASRSRVEDILAIFRQRYLMEDSVTKALVTLVHGELPAAALAKILYFHTARADPLIHDAVTEILIPMREQGLVDINISSFQRSLTRWVDKGKTSGHWSEPTIVRISQGLVSALRDFGVLQGLVNKRIAPVFLPHEAFAYIVFYLKQHQPSGAKLLELPDWKLFFLTRDDVERLLF
jgi:hypothetical protein